MVSMQQNNEEVLRMKGPYACSICGKHYPEEANAKACESGHPTPITIVSCQDYIDDKTQNYPNRLLVEFSDGRRCYYSFDDIEVLEDPYHV